MFVVLLAVNDDRDRDRLLFALLRARCSAGSMGVARSHAKRDALFYKLVAALDLLTLLLRWLIGGLVGSSGATARPKLPAACLAPRALPRRSIMTNWRVCACL